MRIMTAMPRYNGDANFLAATAFYHPLKSGSAHKLVDAKSPQGSLLACTFNAAWAHAQDLYEAGKIDAFAMQHSDQAPEMGWLDNLLDEMERTGADVVGVVAPIKDDRGLTSIAVDDTGDEWLCRRLTLHEVMQLPVTFGDEDVGGPLLLNTGLWVCRLGAWCFDVHFRIHDCIRVEKGKRLARVIPEDWDFSRQLRQKGLRLMATRAVRLNHYGETAYPNFAAWGWEEDLQNGPNGLNFRKDLGSEATVEQLQGVPA